MRIFHRRQARPLTQAPHTLRIVIGAGGTGGHIYPGLAIADAILKVVPGAHITFSGTSRGLEATLVPGHGYQLTTSNMIPFAASLGLRRFALPAYLLRAGIECALSFRRDRVDLVIGMGGYPSAPAIVGAWLARVPRLVHESNALPGKANQLAAILSPHLGIAFDQARKHLPTRGKTIRRVGMPLMPAVAAMDRGSLRREALALLGISPGQRLVVVNGGSQGARSLTAAALELAQLWQARTDVVLLIKTGPADHGQAAQQIAQLTPGHGTRVVEYLERMELVYAAADVMVGRAGAATVAELAHVGLPSVLIPHPWAAGDHQRHNAQVLLESGGAVMVSDRELTGTRLAAELEILLQEPGRLGRMSLAARSGVHTQSAHDMALWAIDLARQNQTKRAPKAVTSRPHINDQPRPKPSKRYTP